MTTKEIAEPCKSCIEKIMKHTRKATLREVLKYIEGRLTVLKNIRRQQPSGKNTFVEDIDIRIRELELIKEILEAKIKDRQME